MDAVPEPARTEDWAAAFRLIFHYLPVEERERRCANALYLLQRGELDPQGIFVLRGSCDLRGALRLPAGSRTQCARLAARCRGGIGASRWRTRCCVMPVSGCASAA